MRAHAVLGILPPKCRVGVLAVLRWDPPAAGGFAESFQVTEQGCLALTPPHSAWPQAQVREALFHLGRWCLHPPKPVEGFRWQ